MPQHYPVTYRYTVWDGTEESLLNPDDVMDALTEDLLRDGNLNLAMQKAFRWGMRNPDGSHSPGLRDLLERLRKQRQEMLDRFNFDSVLGNVRERLDAIVAQERGTLEERARGDTDVEGVPVDDMARLNEFLDKRRQALDALPEDTSSRISALQEYGFVDRQAEQAFEELLEELRKNVADSLFRSLMGAGAGGEGSAEQTKEFLHDLNEAFRQARSGQDVDMDRLNNKWANMLGGRAENMDEIAQRLQARMAAMQALSGLLTPEQRAEIQSLVEKSIRDAGIQEELSQLQGFLGRPQPSGLSQSDFHGDQEIPLEMAMDVLDRAAKMEMVEEELKHVSRLGDLQGLDPDLLQSVLSEQDREWLNTWTRLEQDLVDNGFATPGSDGLELTPRAIRKLGEHALADIFTSLQERDLGEHDVKRAGSSGEIADSSSRWKFGDSFVLDLPRTVMNGIMRNGPGTPVELGADDFEVIDRESRTSTATVLLIDMSRSMLHNGCWDAAKRTALALDTLIRSKYPRDMLELIGFSATAHDLDVTDLPTLEWNEYNYGTNLQHALELARERLRPERGRNRQIIVITDGEPTAYIDEGEVRFNYPPTPEIFEATLREVLRCTREEIRINVFLLEQTPYMARFMEDLMRINRGRVMNAAPNRLGGYVLTDFLQQRTTERRG